VSSAAVPSGVLPSAAGLAGHSRYSRFRLTPGLGAAAEARGHIRAAIRAWQVPVDADAAVLLASELVANAVMHGSAPGSGEPAGAGLASSEPVMLSIRCSRGELRIEVHDQSRDMPLPPLLPDSPAESETGRGLMLVAALAAKWGFYQTSVGKAVYFTLIPHPDDPEPHAGLPERGDGEP
jgi:anti-sigma regulatory factor (Ser/Thr protein kinase)